MASPPRQTSIPPARARLRHTSTPVTDLGLCLFALPLNTYIMRRVKVLQERLMKQKDERMALVSEAINAIRTIKLHAWEPEFEARIAAKRAEEVATLLSFQK